MDSLNMDDLLQEPVENAARRITELVYAGMGDLESIAKREVLQACKESIQIIDLYRDANQPVPSPE